MGAVVRRSAGVAAALVLAGALAACSAPLSFDDEFALSVRAGREGLSEGERADLLKRNHPILMQMGDPGTRGLIEAFARLPDSAHRELRDQTYLKWRYADLSAEHRAPFLALVQANLDLAAQQGTRPHAGFSVAALERAQVGYAVVDLDPAGKGRVVSLVILWPELSSPTWVTVVNGKLAGTQPYFQAHQERLPLLGYMATSTLP